MTGTLENRILNSLFGFRYYYDYTRNIPNNIQDHNNNLFLHTFIDNTKPFFLPTCQSELFYRTGLNKSYFIDCPICVRKSSEKNTSDSILASLFGNSGANLTKVITKKDEVFIGGGGMLFDHSMDPLMLCGSYIEPGDPIKVQKLVCLLSPKLFASKDRISKYIINNVIPFITTTGALSIWHQSRVTLLRNRGPVEVVIKPLEEYFTKPVLLNNSIDNDHIWEFLNNNKEVLCP